MPRLPRTIIFVSKLQSLVNKKGTNITTEDFLTICRKFDISDTATLQIIEQVKNALSGYSRLMKEFG